MNLHTPFAHTVNINGVALSASMVRSAPINNKYDQLICGVFAHNGFIAGSYATHILSDRSKGVPSDIDIYCREVKDFAVLCAYVHGWTGDCGIESHNGRTFHIESKPLEPQSIQVVRPTTFPDGRETFGIPSHVISTFDISVCQCAIVDEDFSYVDTRTGPPIDPPIAQLHYNCIYTERALEDLSDGKITFVNTHNITEAYNMYLFDRAYKYVSKGYTITALELSRAVRPDWINCGDDVRKIVVDLVAADSEIVPVEKFAQISPAFYSRVFGNAP